MKNKNKLFVILAVLCVVLIGAVAFTVISDKKKESKKIVAEDGEASQSNYIEYNGKKYKKNADVKTALFMGIDKSAKADLHNNPGENGQSDSLNLLVMDQKAKTARVLQISRDSMVEIDIYDINGEKLMKEEGQLALQYAYGDGEEKSCRLTSEKVSELLFGISVDNYLSLTLEGMVVATDKIGGITLTVPEDYTAIDPAFEKGKTLTLDGKLAEKYVRSRDTDVLDSNNQRMERQSQFMNVLIEKIQDIDSNREYASLYQDLDPYMVTSMTADELKKVASYDIASEMERVPGEIIEKDGHAQYLVDNDALKKLVIDLFYIEVKN